MTQKHTFHLENTIAGLHGELDDYVSLMHIVLFNTLVDFQLAKYCDLYETNPRTNNHHVKSQAWTGGGGAHL